EWHQDQKVTDHNQNRCHQAKDKAKQNSKPDLISAVLTQCMKNDQHFWLVCWLHYLGDWKHKHIAQNYPTSWGVVHTADLPIIFCNPLDDENSSNVSFTSGEVALCRLMAQFSTNFQRTG
uniref:Carboxylesterase type B domain-containing protein n=1 Tax=Romanomermis culicivorax TaxID=13658 RepID=A0A915KGW9_ROMCU